MALITETPSRIFNRESEHWARFDASSARTSTITFDLDHPLHMEKT